MADDSTWADRLSEWLGEVVVIDCVSPYVAIGRLEGVSRGCLELGDADLHDLRDGTTSRELYLVKVARHGVAANRERLLFRVEQAVSVSRLGDVVSE